MIASAEGRSALPCSTGWLPTGHAGRACVKVHPYSLRRSPTWGHSSILRGRDLTQADLYGFFVRSFRIRILRGCYEYGVIVIANNSEQSPNHWCEAFLLVCVWIRYIFDRCVFFEAFPLDLFVFLP